MRPTVRQILDKIQIDEYSTTPKYKQIVNSVLAGIERGTIKLNEVMPSINDLSMLFDISRDTAEKAYKHLKSLGILDSVPGKGFFIKSTHYRQKRRIFLLFNKLSAHKKIIYDAFAETLGDEAAIDFYVYNNNFRLFRELIENQDGSYTHYVVIAHFVEGGERAAEVLNGLPKEKLVILDKLVPGVTGEYAAVYENFEKDLYDALVEAEDLLRKYHTLKLIFPAHSYTAKEIMIGFQKFCTEYGFGYKILSDVATEPLARGELYLNVMEDDLVTLVKRVKASGLRVGEDLGILSYNETPLKEIILDGITVISTDFGAMGRTAAQLVLDNTPAHVENPFRLIVRKSV